MNYATVGELIFFLSSPDCGKNWILNEPLYFHCHWNRNKLIKSRFWLRSRFLLTVHRSLKNRFGPKKLHEYCYTIFDFYLLLRKIRPKDLSISGISVSCFSLFKRPKYRNLFLSWKMNFYFRFLTSEATNSHHQQPHLSHFKYLPTFHLKLAW